MSLSEFIISAFCIIDDEMQKLNLCHLRQRGFEPRLADSETITLEIVGEFLGIDTDKGIWSYFRTYWLHFFPQIPCHSTFKRQAANLWRVKQVVQESLSQACGGKDDFLHSVDGLPIKVCSLGHAYQCQAFKGVANFGYCASKDEFYYGFKGHLVINSEGTITNSEVTPANVDERDVVPFISSGLHGLMLGDKGYIRTALQQELERQGLNLLTPARSNMGRGGWEKYKKFFGDARRLIETVIGQLSERLHIERVRARDAWHMTSRWARKLLAHTVAIWINKLRGAHPLDFDGIVASP
jgi:hypothetical protein